MDRRSGVLTVPIFHVSSVSGLGLALMHSFLRALPTGAALSSFISLALEEKSYNHALSRTVVQELQRLRLHWHKASFLVVLL